MGLSIRAYARHRGVSHVAVKKAIASEGVAATPAPAPDGAAPAAPPTPPPAP